MVQLKWSRNHLTMKTIRFSILLSLWWIGVSSFAPVPGAPQHVLSKTPRCHECMYPRRQVDTYHKGRCRPLKYREHEEDDDETAMLKLKTRAPLGFNMKENLRQRMPSSAMNLPLIKALLLNQGIILVGASVLMAGIVFGTDGLDGVGQIPTILQWSSSDPVTASLPLRFVHGLIGCAPVILLGNSIEASDSREFANVNFSTITMVMTLFGRRTAIPDEFRPERLKGQSMPTTRSTEALIQSLILATVTGICEETVFRTEIPGLLHFYLGGGLILPWIGQAVLFGLGHSQPGSNVAENGIVVGLQFVNGLLFGLIYILSGGDVVPSIVAHAAYDFSVFFKTWWDSNSQLEYAEEMYGESFPSNVQAEVDQVLKSNPRIEPRLFNLIKRLFYTFDFDKNMTLSKSEVRKGFSYLSLERGAGMPPPQEQIDALFDTYTTAVERNRLSFADFLRLYTKSAAEA